MSSTTTSCLICNAPLSFHQSRSDKLCSSLTCQWKYNSLPKSQLCASCGRPLSLQQIATRFCDTPECRRAFVDEQAREKVREQERDRQRVEAQKDQARKLRDAVAAAVGIREPESYPIALIPSYSAPITNLPDHRRKAFCNHLTSLVTQAAVAQAAPPASGKGAAAVAGPAAMPAPAHSRVLEHACARCQGFCCGRGGVHAYLTVETIHRFLDAHPGLQPAAVIGAYMDSIGMETYEGSCVFHGTRGCTLPREMRSDTCNQYFCPGLEEFRNEHGERPVRGFVASPGPEAIRAAAFIDETGLREVPVPPAENASG